MTLLMTKTSRLLSGKRVDEFERRPPAFEEIAELDNIERDAPHNEVLHEWRQPFALYFTVILCSVGAAVQCWDQILGDFILWPSTNSKKGPRWMSLPDLHTTVLLLPPRFSRPSDRGRRPNVPLLPEASVHAFKAVIGRTALVTRREWPWTVKNSRCNMYAWRNANSYLLPKRPWVEMPSINPTTSILGS